MTVVLLVVGLLLLYVGAELLVKGAVSAAFRLGISPLAIGLTVVAYGTSAPEMAVSVQSALTGSGDIAVANVVGSNSFNIALILGLTALICPIRITEKVIRFDIPIMIGASAAALFFLMDGHLSRPEGMLFFAGIVGYTVWTFGRARNEPAEVMAQEIEETLPPKTGSMVRAILFIVLGLVLLVAGSRAMVAGAINVARAFGISEAVIGLTIVSAGTSLPELSTSMIAAIRRQPDISVGNIVGSNIFNILAILGASSMLAPISAPGLSGVDLGMMLTMAVVSLPFMWSRFTLSRVEGAIFLGCYGAYLWYLWP